MTIDTSKALVSGKLSKRGKGGCCSSGDTDIKLNFHIFPNSIEITKVINKSIH